VNFLKLDALIDFVLESQFLNLLIFLKEKKNLTKTLSYAEANFLVEGAEILGTGGGGDSILALEQIKEIYSQERNCLPQQDSPASP